MSLGGDFSSSRTEKLADQVIQCNIPKIAYSKPCCSNNSGYQPVASYPSVVINKYTCPGPTPAEFALFPKVAIPSSVRTLTLQSNLCATLPDPKQRFSQYNRYQVPVPCPPLTPLAISAGISQPSTRLCNIYPIT